MTAWAGELQSSALKRHWLHCRKGWRRTKVECNLSAGDNKTRHCLHSGQESKHMTRRAEQKLWFYSMHSYIIWQKQATVDLLWGNGGTDRKLSSGCVLEANVFSCIYRERQTSLKPHGKSRTRLMSTCLFSVKKWIHKNKNPTFPKSTRNKSAAIIEEEDTFGLRVGFQVGRSDQYIKVFLYCLYCGNHPFNKASQIALQPKLLISSGK